MVLVYKIENFLNHINRTYNSSVPDFKHSPWSSYQWNGYPNFGARLPYTLTIIGLSIGVLTRMKILLNIKVVKGRFSFINSSLFFYCNANNFIFFSNIC